MTKKISDPTIRRLSRYYRSIKRLRKEGIETVSSQQLAEIDGITSAQVRKDLSFFGTFGKRGLGYNTGILEKKIATILGLVRTWNVAIVGAGNICRALVDYNEFKQQGFNIKLILDSDPQKIGAKLKGIQIESINDVARLIKEKKIDIVIIAVPAKYAQHVADLLVHAGVRAILNFAPRSLKVPDNVQVKYENMAIEMEALSYFLTNDA